jgi:alpha-mannosidase
MARSSTHRHLSRLLAGAVALAATPLAAQGPRPPVDSAAGSASRAAATHVEPDLINTPTLYLVGYAHLDTEWRWEYPQVISEYLLRTMEDNFKLFDKYPAYVFNFTGSNRYRLMKEYWPADYARMTGYIKAGRWFPAGSSVEEGDVNAPSAEAILRQVLYGNEYFRNEFGVASEEYMLPDCFGFPWSLPSILAHAGIKGFSTQKLTWGSSVPDDSTTPYGMDGKGVPFNFGRWIGPDGKGVIAALNPGDYGARISYNLALKSAVDSSARRRVGDSLAYLQPWLQRLAENKNELGLDADYKYYGTGDVGGAPTDSSVMWVQRAVDDTSGAIHVVSAEADQFFKDITPAERSRLPSYTGEMELQNHSAGSLTSQAYEKRWIRENEILADAAEKASVAAMWLGGRSYPMRRLNDAWTLIMGSHFHDLAAGTATPRAYEFAWNDDVIALNQMSDVLQSGSEAVASAMNTQLAGTPIVVFNPLNHARQDVVEVTVPDPSASRQVRVTGPDGTAVPAQVDSVGGGMAQVVFEAGAPSVGYAAYGVQTGRAGAPSSELRVSTHALENDHYRVAIDANGDVSSIFDKRLDRELLQQPIRLALMQDIPSQWPAWNMDFADEQRPPRGYVDGPADIRVTEQGPARVAVTVRRAVDSSIFLQTVSLAAGAAGDRVQFHNAIDWHMPATALKATFVLTAADSQATYNLDVGTIRRGNAYDRKFEVPTHQWIDLTDHSGTFGATILTGDKNGSDKPNDNTIRLTLLRTPGLPNGRGGYGDQTSQDFGHHEFNFGIAGHAGDYRAGQTDWTAWRLNTPLMAFTTPAHTGPLGRSFSLVRVSNPRVRLMALKRAESGNEIVLRMVELNGSRQPDVRVAFAAPVAAAREINGQEQPVGGAMVQQGSLVTSLSRYQIRTFAVRLGAAPSRAMGVHSAPVPLQFDRSVASTDGSATVGGFNDAGEALPAEMLPDTLDYNGVQFHLGPARTGVPDAVTANGQRIMLPAGQWNRVYLLAASAGGDRPETFHAGAATANVLIHAWDGFVGQWDDRVWKDIPAPPPTPEQIAAQQRAQARFDSLRLARIDSVLKAGGDTSKIPAFRGRGRGNRGPRTIQVVDSIIPGYIKDAPIAWYASHKHDARGADEYYQYSYLFAYAIDLPAGATSITLPTDSNIRILAMSVADEPDPIAPAHPLHDTLGRTSP